jgi:probable phosphomutase (TIGR03848 family)
MGVLLLVRHGRTSANVEGILAGRLPGVLLDEVGERTVRDLAQRLREVPVKQVVTSPLERTVATADLLFGTRVVTDRDVRLVECDYGTWQGRALSELAKLDEWSTVQSAPDTFTFPEGEAMSAMADRAVSCIQEWDQRVTAEYGDSAVWAAVSHGDVIKAIVAHALGTPLAKFQRIMVDPASVTVIRYGEHGSAVLKLNDAGDAWLSALKTADDSAQPTIGGQRGLEQGE